MKAALLTKIGEPLELCEIEPCLPLGYGQVLVKVTVSGICGRQLKEIDGWMPGGPLPHPLGHEGCGIVQEIGPHVSHVKPGDKVVMHWRKGAGIEAEFAKYRLGVGLGVGLGTEITGGRVTTFMEEAVCSENRLTAVPSDTPDELCALLGCSLSTALATLEYEAKLLRGESILIVGCGGLGVNLIVAARLMGAWPICATDIMQKDTLARALGAQFCGFNPESMINDTRDLYAVIVETSGRPEAIRATLPLLAPSGRYIMVGQPHPGESFSVAHAVRLFEGEGKSIKATQGGSFRPERDCPRYVRFFRNCPSWMGQLLAEQVVSDRYPLAEINEALARVRTGHAGRVLVTM